MKMNLLCMDIGSGTQDILLLDTSQPVENAIQLVLPAPTILVARQIQSATLGRNTVVLIGETMGGGANTRALMSHLQAGLKAYATPEAARTFDDDLKVVTSWGVIIVSEDEARSLEDVLVIQTRDLDFERLRKALANWDIALSPDVFAVAVLDHGAAPPGESDRIFRFRHLEQMLRKNQTLESFIFTPDDLPEYLTRMRAVVKSAGATAPLVLMDTGAAAVLGASLDPFVTTHARRLCINVGNSHTLAFHLDESRVLAMFEHHTSMLSARKIDSLSRKLLSGKLNAAEVQEDGGHGAVVLEKGEVPFVSVTGPRRQMLSHSRLNPYFAAPFGSMMLAGCFGLAQAVSLKSPHWRDEIDRALLP